MNVHDTDSLPKEWLRPTPLPFIPPRIDIEYGPKTQYHTCGNCKYDTVTEKDEPCINCIHGVDMRKDLWQPKGE